jgi:hypothetical protein
MIQLCQRSYLRLAVPKSLTGGLGEIFAEAGDALIRFYTGLFEQRHRGLVCSDSFEMKPFIMMMRSVVDLMRTGKSPCDVSPNAKLISQALTVQLRTEYDVTQPYPANIDTLLQRLVCQEIDRETAQERDRIWNLSEDLLMVTDLSGRSSTSIRLGPQRWAGLRMIW